MNTESTARVMEMTSDIIRNTLAEGGGVVLCGVNKDEKGFITHYAGRNTPRSITHMALTLLRQAQDDLFTQDQSHPLNEDDESFLTDLGAIVTDLEFYVDPEARS
jgi:hypothetical protein